MASNYANVSGCMVWCEEVRVAYAEALEEILGLLVDIQRARLAVLGEIESGDLRDVLILALTLLFLELEGDTADRSSLNTLHPALD